MQAFYDELLPPKRLAVVPGANHLFNGQVEEVGAAIVRLLVQEQD
jgi:alpha/beta superfamily hydrolase